MAYIQINGCVNLFGLEFADMADSQEAMGRPPLGMKPTTVRLSAETIAESQRWWAIGGLHCSFAKQSRMNCSAEKILSRQRADTLYASLPSASRHLGAGWTAPNPCW